MHEEPKTEKEETKQCMGLSPTAPGVFHSNENRTNHARTISLDQSKRAAHNSLLTLVRQTLKCAHTLTLCVSTSDGSHALGRAFARR